MITKPHAIVLIVCIVGVAALGWFASPETPRDDDFKWILLELLHTANAGHFPEFGEGGKPIALAVITKPTGGLSVHLGRRNTPQRLLKVVPKTGSNQTAESAFVYSNSAAIRPGAPAQVILVDMMSGYHGGRLCGCSDGTVFVWPMASDPLLLLGSIYYSGMLFATEGALDDFQSVLRMNGECEEAATTRRGVTTYKCHDGVVLVKRQGHLAREVTVDGSMRTTFMCNVDLVGRITSVCRAGDQ